MLSYLFAHHQYCTPWYSLASSFQASNQIYCCGNVHLCMRSEEMALKWQGWPVHPGRKRSGGTDGKKSGNQSICDFQMMHVVQNVLCICCINKNLLAILAQPENNEKKKRINRWNAKSGWDWRNRSRESRWMKYKSQHLFRSHVRRRAADRLQQWTWNLVVPHSAVPVKVVLLLLVSF